MGEVWDLVSSGVQGSSQVGNLPSSIPDSPDVLGIFLQWAFLPLGSFVIH